jgi:hypothetical protein
MIVFKDHSISWAVFVGDMECSMGKTSFVIQPRHLVTVLWLMLIEPVKRLVATSQIQLAFVSELWRIFRQWITQGNDDPH